MLVCLCLQEGGQLYTWGGAFEDITTLSLPLTPKLPAQKDNHQGCLGHGDKAGRLTPTRSAAAGSKHGMSWLAMLPDSAWLVICWGRTDQQSWGAVLTPQLSWDVFLEACIQISACQPETCPVRKRQHAGRACRVPGALGGLGVRQAKYGDVPCRKRQACWVEVQGGRAPWPARA